MADERSTGMRQILEDAAQIAEAVVKSHPGVEVRAPEWRMGPATCSLVMRLNGDHGRETYRAVEIVEEWIHDYPDDERVKLMVQLMVFDTVEGMAQEVG